MRSCYCVSTRIFLSYAQDFANYTAFESLWTTKASQQVVGSSFYDPVILRTVVLSTSFKKRHFFNVDEQVVAFREDQSNELDAMVSLRTFNTEKFAGHVDVAADKYCICRHSRTSSMLQCEVCKDLFHGRKLIQLIVQE
jgi:hypothetical protein